MSEEIFIRILNNSATEAEKSSFFQSMEEDSDLREQYQQFKNLYVASSLNPELSDSIQKESFEKFWNRVNPGKPKQVLNWWYRYAAVVLVTLATSFFIQYLIQSNPQDKEIVQKIEYSSEKGSVSKVMLEDGSAIWLSSASSVKLEKRENGEMMASMSGEAYFDMVPDPGRKFSVAMGSFKVKDIGTKFNIRAYKDEPGVYTSLVDGKIEFLSKSDQKLLSLNPGEYMQFNNQSMKMTVSEQDPTIATAWKDGKFVFIDKTLEEICHELENWYNVKIVIENKTLAATKYTSVIKRTTTIKLVLQMLTLTDKINYSITDKKEGSDIVLIY
ncbi:MAG: FecR domain-containing protein [Prolixibacteraceae bacterium]